MRSPLICLGDPKRGHNVLMRGSKGSLTTEGGGCETPEARCSVAGFDDHGTKGLEPRNAKNAALEARKTRSAFSPEPRKECSPADILMSAQ